MLEAAFWGLLTAGSLWVGAAIGIFGRPSDRFVGLALAFGAGALIAAVAYELVIEAFNVHGLLAAVGFTAGALTFYIGDAILDRRGAEGRKSMAGQSQLAAGASAIVLGTVLDGIPESIVLGATLLQGGGVPIAVAVGVFVSNVPEALSGSVGLTAAGWSRRRVLLMWTAVVGVSVLATVAGWYLLDKVPAANGAFAMAFAAGALLVMLSDTLIPEAFEHGGREAGLVTALGFAVGFGLS